MGAAALPRCPGQGGPDRIDEPSVGIGGDQFDPRKAAGGQRPQEGQPAGPVLGGGDVNPEDLAVALGVDPDRDQRVHVDHTPLFTDLEDQGVGGHEGVRAGVEGPGAERFDGGVRALWPSR